MQPNVRMTREAYCSMESFLLKSAIQMAAVSSVRSCSRIKYVVGSNCARLW